MPRAMTNKVINAIHHLLLREVDVGAIGGGTLCAVSSVCWTGGVEVNRASSSFGVRVGSSEVGASNSGVPSPGPALRSNDADVFFRSVVFISFPSPPHLSVIPTSGSNAATAFSSLVSCS